MPLFQSGLRLAVEPKVGTEELGESPHRLKPAWEEKNKELIGTT
jgi:hypothetical protein